MAGTAAVEFPIDELPLQPGAYTAVAASRDIVSQQIGSWTSGPPFTVRPGKMARGLFYLPHRPRHITTTDGVPR